MGNGVSGSLFQLRTHPFLWPLQVSVSRCLTFPSSAHFLFHCCLSPPSSRSTSSSCFPFPFLFSPLSCPSFSVSVSTGLSISICTSCVYMSCATGSLCLAVSVTVSRCYFVLFLQAPFAPQSLFNASELETEPRNPGLPASWPWLFQPTSCSPLFSSQSPPAPCPAPSGNLSWFFSSHAHQLCPRGSPCLDTPYPSLCLPNAETRNPLQQG